MIRKNSMWCLLGITIFCTSQIVADEAIISGHEARENQFPYQAAVIAKGFHTLCGGGILTSEFIITAAHCVISDNDTFYGDTLSVFVGSNNIWKPSQLAHVSEVKKIYVPQEYTPPLFRATGDIAILQLRFPLDLKQLKHLKKLKLPEHDENHAGLVGRVAGFGWNWIRLEGTNQFGNNSDGHLRFSETYITSNDQCKREHPLLTISDKYICAKSKQRHTSQPVGVCTGDSGSPLVIDATVVGILSFGPAGCREIVSSAIYTRVSQYLTFIKNVMKEKGLQHMRIQDLPVD